MYNKGYSGRGREKKWQAGSRRKEQPCHTHGEEHGDVIINWPHYAGYWRRVASEKCSLSRYHCGWLGQNQKSATAPGTKVALIKSYFISNAVATEALPLFRHDDTVCFIKNDYCSVVGDPLTVEYV